MKIKVLLCFLFTISLYGFISASNIQDDNESLLLQLDHLIKEKNSYHQKREEKISDLKEMMSSTHDFYVKYGLCDSLFHEYLHYQADSSLYYVDLKLHYLRMLKRSDLEPEIYINRAEVLGVMGMYSKAFNQLQQVDLPQMNHQTLLYYYRTLCAYHVWIADYITDYQGKQNYWIKSEVIRDTLISLSEPGLEQQLLKAERLIFEKKAKDAISIMSPLFDEFADPQFYTDVNYMMSEAYKIKNDTLNQIKYLARTAIRDMHMAVREYASLQNLARVLYLTGDLDRAYRYLTCSMEDAVACNARLRFIQITEFYPIIDKAYKLKANQQKRGFQLLLICISMIAVILILCLGYLYSWNKKLSLMRRKLFDANCKLKAANNNLEQTGKIKEVYIARYLDRCVIYLEKLEQYRRSLEKLAMASKINELYNAIRSEEFIKDERKEFYMEFDRSFLDLFPDFVTDFNNLLTNEGKVILKSGELLNTELRIFALIRLGITNTTQIAHFLGYSLATVYNYRSKLRNRAKNHKETFEQDVMNL